jgi:hypothetical protein
MGIQFLGSKQETGYVVIQTPFGKIITDDGHFRVGQEYGSEAMGGGSSQCSVPS